MPGSIVEIRYDVHEIIEEYSSVINMTFRQFINAYYVHHTKIPELYDLIRFFPQLNVDELVLGLSVVKWKWQHDI